MQRTQIYLTKEEIAALKRLSTRMGLNQSELIRQAVDDLIERNRSTGRKDLLAVAKGLWKDRTDLPDLGHLRREWDRAGL